jgi:hypothetical protein
MKRRKRLTLKELNFFVEDYHKVFKEWYLINPDIFVREEGPILQYIGFERLSWGDYRPSSGIYVMCVPERDGGFGPQWLNVKVRSIDPGAHERLREIVVTTMKSEFIPDVEKPLVPEEVLDYLERKVVPKSADICPLAGINAFLGHEDRAIYWCGQFEGLVKEPAITGSESIIRRREYLYKLAAWIKNGEAKQRLEEILKTERKNWGLS